MSHRPALLFVLAAALLAGCAGSPSPIGAADAEHPGATCAVGRVVTGFSSDGSPSCTALPHAGFECPVGSFVTSFDDLGVPECDKTALPGTAPTGTTSPEPAPRAKTLSLTSAGALSNGMKTYTVASASPGMRWSDLSITVDGAPYAQNTADPCTATGFGDAARFQACSGGAAETSSGTVDAGDSVRVFPLASGQLLRVIDAQANAVILTLSVG